MRSSVTSLAKLKLALCLAPLALPQTLHDPSALGVERVARLTGRAQVQALGELLQGMADGGGEHAVEALFPFESSLRPALRALVTDPNLRRVAMCLLSMIGDPADVAYILARNPQVAPQCVASAIVDPTSEAEWKFLRQAATGRFEEPWAAIAAVTSLKLIGSPRSLKILEESIALPQYASDASWRGAVDYVRSSPSPMSDRSLDVVARRVGEALRESNDQSVETGTPLFSRTGNRAVINLDVVNRASTHTYAAVFQRTAANWRLRSLNSISIACSFGLTAPINQPGPPSIPAPPELALP